MCNHIIHWVVDISMKETKTTATILYIVAVVVVILSIYSAN